MARRPSTVRPAALFGTALLLAGCAELHRGSEAVGRIGGPPAAAAADVTDDDAAFARPTVRTVRPLGAPRAPVSDLAEAAPAPEAAATAVPSPRQIFDFHPAGTPADGWRQPFVIDTNDGPLAADVRRSKAELKAFMAEHRAADVRAATATAAKVDGSATGTARRRCSEMDVATAKPGCAVPRSGTDAGAPSP